MLIDSHAHLDFYAKDIDGVVSRAREAGVGTILAIGIGEGPEEMHRALEIAHRYPSVYASVGIHPSEAAKATPEALGRLSQLAADPLCVAVGEIGLDYYHVENPLPEVQEAAFISQMEIAAMMRKPILIHCRTSELATPAAKQKFEGLQNGNPNAAWDDLLRLIVQYWTSTGLPGVMHCFSGGVAEAKRSLAAGFYLSFAGNLTYPKSQDIREAAAFAPADRILLETDCPFLAPIPHRGQQNEPALMMYTAVALAELRGISVEQVAALTTKNFHELFPTTA
jgi:TatD DNase family protein